MMGHQYWELASPEEIEAAIINELHESIMDLSSSEVAHSIGLSERCARNYLIRMANENKVENTRTVCHAQMYTVDSDE